METESSKEIVEQLKEQWKKLWREYIDDKLRAEGIASVDFSSLFVDKGTVIFATRDFKPMNFREILQVHKLIDVDRFVSPSPTVGGWRKFIRTAIAGQKSSGRAREVRVRLEKGKQRQQLKKGGRGWLHF